MDSNKGVNANIKYKSLILKDIKKLTEQYNDYNLDDEIIMKFNIVNEQINIWNFKLHYENFKDYNELYNDMKKYNIEYIDIEVIIPNEFPFEPPFIRIIGPVFQYKTGHITVGGSICMDILTTDKWNCVMGLDKIILIIKHNIIDGKGKIDINRLGQKYSYKEAVSAFNRMVKNHPEWKT